MTETDAAADPVDIPVTFMPYLEKYRLYKLFKDMMQDLVVNLPRDHLKHMKRFLQNMTSRDTVRLILLVSPELDIDIPFLVRALVRDFGTYVISRRAVMDHYEKHDDYKPGCFDPALMSEVTRIMTIKDELVQNGWLMFDHPCTLHEARCLQQDGVLPTITLAVVRTPPVAPPAENCRTPMRTFFEQDFEGLKYAYEATLKEVHIEPTDSMETVSTKCYNAALACASGAQGSGQGLHATGAPGIYRVALIGPRAAGRRTQAHMVAKHLKLVFLDFESLYSEAEARDDELGKWLRKHGPSVQMKAEIVHRRMLKKDCITRGYVLTGFPSCGAEFELFEHMETPPNRIVFLNSDFETCKQRIQERGTDWCTGQRKPLGSERTLPHPRDTDDAVEKELDFFFSEGLAEMRAAAGLTAWEVDSTKPVDEVHTKILAAIMAAPANDIKCNYSAGRTLDNARAD